MTPYFFDSSALVKRYAKEVGSVWIIGLLRPSAGNVLYASSITMVEVTAALARRRRGHSLSATTANKSIHRFQRNFRKQFFDIAVAPAILAEAARLADSHEIRGYDAVQLATALAANRERLANGLSPLILISADDELNSAATVEGLTVDNPNHHP